MNTTAQTCVCGDLDEVLNEEIIVHPTIEWRGKHWRGTARIMGTVTIEGQRYSFEYVVNVTFLKSKNTEDSQ
jgi:hypothetical protein